MFDTRTRIFLLLDYKEYYGQEKSLQDAQKLIEGIPSATLLNYISGFNVHVYLREQTVEEGKIQFMLVDSLLGKCGPQARQKWVSVVKAQQEAGYTPIMFWNYTNLLFYSLIFSKFNKLPTRDLTGDEAQRVWDAYLILNYIANEKIMVEAVDIQNAAAQEKVEDVVMPAFLYQRDYISSTDFTNQITRGIKFFQYLEGHTRYSSLMEKYYRSKNISGYLRMFKNLLVLFAETNIGNKLKQRKQLVNIREYQHHNEVDFNFLDVLSINKSIDSYKQDLSFGLLRNKFLYKLDDFKYLILDVNFLLDQFYKSQVFSFNTFLKQQGVKGDFLAEKGKKFTEEVYLPEVLKSCFPHLTTFFGNDCVNSSKEELCDAYIRDENKICLIEFKDILLNATVKNDGGKGTLFPELDKKFMANQQNRPKGITQLANAVRDVEENALSFDAAVPHAEIEIYPVILYTDNTFGSDGINKLFKEKFRTIIEGMNLRNVAVKEVTFINLSFFESREVYFSKRQMQLFALLDEYHQHTAQPDYSLTPFEVFARFYTEKYVPEDLGSSQAFKVATKAILAAK